MDEIKNDLRIPMEQPLDLVVIAVKKSALRCITVTSNESITFRKVRDEVEGEIITVKPSKVWRYKRTHYMTGEIISRRLDIPGLNLKPLALTNMGPWDPQEEYRGEPDEPIDKYCKPIIDYGERESYEMEQIIPFQDPGDFDSDPIVEASDYYSSGNDADALKIMEKILTADLRCLDAHAHLGNWDFDSEYRLDKAKRHYEVGVKIGELSFNDEFNGVLSWGHIDNRPYLRCLHGYGLTLWRLDKPEEARKIFNKILWLNPRDNQGIRFLLADIDAGKTWQECTQ